MEILLTTKAQEDSSNNFNREPIMQTGTLKEKEKEDLTPTTLHLTLLSNFKRKRRKNSFLLKRSVMSSILMLPSNMKSLHLPVRMMRKSTAQSVSMP